MREFLSCIGACALGAFVGLLTILLIHPTFSDRRVSAERRFGLLLKIVLLIIGELLASAAVGYFLPAELAAAFGCVGLLAGALGAFAWEKLKKLRVVKRAKRLGDVVRRTLQNDSLGDPNFQAKLKEMLDDLTDK